MLTANSSAEILPFQPNQPTNRKGSFEAWRESWVRSIVADSNLWNCDKSVATFLSFHLNRETRSCFPSYATIGRGVGIDRLNARRSIKRLVARGYLVRERRGKGHSNLYFPAEGVVVHDHSDRGRVWSQTTTGVVVHDHSSVVVHDHLTSESTSDLTLGSSEKKNGLPRGPSAQKEEKKAKLSVGPSSPLKTENESAAAPGGVPRAAPNGNGGESVWVKYDTPTWDMVERFGHRAVGKVFMRYGRVEGAWILKSDLRAIEAMAGGGQ
jgi:hypothetical protein